MENMPGRLHTGESVMDIRQVLKDTRAFACVECGKCSAACSMAGMYADFSLRASPRAFVQQALRLGRAEQSFGLWRCLQCGNCTAICPEGVDVAACIAALRKLTAGEYARLDRACARCGRALMPLPARQWLEARIPTQKETEDDEAASARSHFSGLCPVCRRLAYAYNNTVG
jgi:Fe-S oxidoreductase